MALIFLATAQAGKLRAPAFGLLMANVCFLIAIMVFAADPMKASLAARTEGMGLSPLLQHPSMLVHPPVVFLAYAAWTVPFALAAAALVTGELSKDWIGQARPWALFAWTVLGAGLLLGAHWAYQELGWGGYWGWDPVENGSLLPWLTGTALIHCLMAWRHCGCLKKLALSLAIVTFGLCNFATFLTRSGVFSSVHAFSESPIGWMFLGLMAVLLVGGGALILRRREALAPERPIRSALARESLVLVSTYLLLVMTVVVLVGTSCVPLSTMFLGRTAQIGPAFYNNVFMPIGLALLTATAVAPLLRWDLPPAAAHKRALVGCLGAGGIAALVAWLAGVRHPASLAVAGLAALAVAALATALLRDAARMSHSRRWHTILGPGVWLALSKRRRQYAGFVVHLGIVCVAVGVTGSSLATQRLDIDLKEGDSLDWAGRRIEYVRLIQREEPDKLVAEIELKVSRAGDDPVTLMPARHLHLLQNEWTTEVAIHSTWAGDFYTILHAGLGDGGVAVTLVENPMMRWIWFGGWLAAAGAGVAAWPERKRRSTKQSVAPAKKETPIASKQRKAA
jgi:cytochrome c-type biogenesis protein CcmF